MSEGQYLRRNAEPNVLANAKEDEDGLTLFRQRPIALSIEQERLRIQKSTILKAAIPFLSTMFVVGVSSWDDVNYDWGQFWAVIINGALNAFLYSTEVPETLDAMMGVIRDQGLQYFKSWSNVGSFYFLLNCAAAGAMLVPGNFFSINDTRENYNQGVIFAGVVLSFLLDFFMLFIPLNDLIIEPVRALYRYCKGIPSHTRSELLQAYFQQAIDGTFVNHKRKTEVRDAFGQERTYGTIASTKPTAFLAKIAHGPISNDAAEMYRHYFSEFQPPAQTWKDKVTYRNFFKMAFWGFSIFMMPLMLLSSAGSMQRTAQAFNKHPLLSLLMWCVPLTKLLLVENTMVVAAAGFAAGMLTTYYPAIAMNKVFEMMIAPLWDHHVKNHGGKYFAPKAVALWLAEAGIVALTIRVLTSAFEIDQEGQDKIIDDGGAPADVLQAYYAMGVNVNTQVYTIEAALNYAGALGLLSNALVMASLGARQLRCFTRIFTNDYTPEQKTYHWLKVAAQICADKLTPEQRHNIDNGSTAKLGPVKNSEELRDALMVAKYWAQQTPSGRVKPQLSELDIT